MLNVLVGHAQINRCACSISVLEAMPSYFEHAQEEVIAQHGSSELPALHPHTGRRTGVPELREGAPREREQLCDRLGAVVRALARRLR